MFVLVLVSLFAGVCSLPFQNGSGTPNHFLSTEDFRYLSTLPKAKAGARLPGFKYIYLEANGQLTTTLNTAHAQLEIAASPRCSQHALDVAADVILKMTKFMPASMFNTLTRGTVGIFTAAEKLTIYPEMANLASGTCGSSCEGSCSNTCTFDGRKYEDIGGLTNSRAVVLDDIVVCSNNDPYHHTVNILSHEFGHLVNFYAATATVKQQITNAYNVAKQRQTWDLNSYAMANSAEYFAMATAAFFGVTHEGIVNSGGMNLCGGYLCPTLQQARDQMKSRDPALYDILVHVYNNNNPNINVGLSICPSGNTLVG
ncbi:uncharacterized protein LOC131936575 [Physella acuta]|uniref:uncharacterized protein LOC131936575 n=1 Tax=Physella acuta TaxID=109671 RepID=UPI0027DE539E|nr:uncharacterized protein LOC131936575 [Physella acuta]